MNDELRNILGDELFAELTELGEEINADMEVGVFKSLTSEQIELLKEQILWVEMPLPGDLALGMVSALIHATRTGCARCEDELATFTSEVIAHIWFALLASIGDDDE